MAFDPSTITVQDFKDNFYRDFVYLPTWVNTVTYNTGDLVYYDVTQNFYIAELDGVTSTPDTVGDWLINNDQSILNFVADQDIDRAYTLAHGNFPLYLFECDKDTLTKQAFLLLEAFYLKSNLDSASTGLGGKDSGVIQSKSVGSVSVSYAQLEQYMDKDQYQHYATNQYGLQYLGLLIPRLATQHVQICNVFS